MPEIAYVNGRFLPLEQATVHVEDRGFQFADGVYEVVRTYGGRPFAMAEHLGRLFHSLEAVEFAHDFTPAGIQKLIEEAILHADFPESLVYLQITRGTAPRHRGVPKDCRPTIVMTVRELPAPSPSIRPTGISVITAPDSRWLHCDIKSVALLANVLAYQSAKKQGAADAIFVEEDGTITEATAGNVFVVKGGRVRTPPKGPKILSGVTRDKVIAAARACGLECAESAITPAELVAADELFLTSTTAEVLPVTTVNKKTIGSGVTGKISRRIYEQFFAMYIRP